MEYRLVLSNIKTLAKAQGRTITSLAVELELSKESLSMYINGKRQPRLDIIVKLASILHTTTDYLLGLSDNPNKEEVNLNEKESLLLMNYRSLTGNDKIYIESYAQAMVDIKRKEREKVLS